MLDSLRQQSCSCVPRCWCEDEAFSSSCPAHGLWRASWPLLEPPPQGACIPVASQTSWASLSGAEFSGTADTSYQFWSPILPSRQGSLHTGQRLFLMSSPRSSPPPPACPRTSWRSPRPWSRAGAFLSSEAKGLPWCLWAFLAFSWRLGRWCLHCAPIGTAL